jgi:PAS domain S-box-containing protein
LELGREVHLEMNEEQLAAVFLRTLERLFPGRALAIRVFDARSAEVARAYAVGGELRRDAVHDRIALKRSAVEKTRLKTAVAESARLRIADRWDSPFRGLARGFAVPLVASGEIYGVLDVGYALGDDLAARDEPLILPMANHLSVLLRNERLHRETSVLRDYQATLIEHANALIVGVDSRWRITVCNQAMCRLLGADRSDLLGADMRAWLPSAERSRLTSLFLAVLSGGETDTFEAELVTRRGERVRTMWSIAAINRRGTLQAVVAVGQDQTKLRELQGQIIQAEKLATLGQLAAGVVHELNNPLTSITVYADYLTKKAELAGEGARLEARDVAKLRQINASAQRILSFARELVHYAKPAGSERRHVALDAVVAQSLSFCEHLFGQDKVKLVRDFQAALPAIDAVPGQLEQIVINLVTNAVHAAPEGGTVWVTTYPAGPDHVGLRVEDDGEGIPDEIRGRIFEPFFTTKYDGAGTGLGLSIVKNIVEHHRGRIEVSPGEHGGARFDVMLPIRQMAAKG